MNRKFRSTAIFFFILNFIIFACSPPSQVPVTPANPDASPTAPATESSNAEPPLSDIISSDNTKNLAEISSWGKGSGHHPTYSPDGTLIVVSTSSGIYLYDAQTWEEKMYFAQRDVLEMAFSTDGKTLSTIVETYEVADDPSFMIFGLLQQWDVTNGSLLHTLKMETNNKYDWQGRFAVFSPDGSTLATNVIEETVKVWDVVSEEEILSLSDPYFLGPLALSPDSETLATTDYTGVTLWDVSSGARLRRIVTSPDLANPSIISLAFSPNGTTLATGSERGLSGGTLRATVQLWDVANGNHLDGFSDDIDDIVTVLTFSPDGTRLAAGSADAIKLWDAANGNELLSINAGNLESLAFSSDGGTLISASSAGDDSVKLWNTATGDLLFTLKGDDVGSNVIWSADSRTLAYESATGFTLGLRDVASGEIRTLSGHPYYVESMAFSPDGTMLASTSMWNAAVAPNNLLKLWDVESGQELHILDGHNSSVASAAFSVDGLMLASASSDGTIKLWDVASGDELRTLSGNTGQAYGVAFSPDRTMLASAFNDEAGDVVKLWDVASGSELRTLSVNTAMGLNVAFSPDGNVLVSSYYFGYGLKQLWDVASGEEILTFSEDTDTERSFTLSSDGETLATSFEGGILKLWDMTSRQELHTLSCNSKAVRGLDFSPDGTLLASGCGEDIKLWDVASGQELASLTVVDVYSLSFSPDGKLILVRSFRGMSLWGVLP